MKCQCDNLDCGEAKDNGNCHSIDMVKFSTTKPNNEATYVIEYGNRTRNVYGSMIGVVCSGCYNWIIKNVPLGIRERMAVIEAKEYKHYQSLKVVENHLKQVFKDSIEEIERNNENS